MIPTDPVTVVHVADRLSPRGGADLHLRSVVNTAPSSVQQTLVTGSFDPEAAVNLEPILCPDLAAKDAPVPLSSYLDGDPKRRLVHVHNVVNPAFLEQMVGERVVLTVQDHKMFCPGRGKWIPGVGRCDTTFNRDACAQCFAAGDYFDMILSVTERRRAALAQMPAVIVLSEYMKSELIQVGVARERIQVLPPTVYDLGDPNPQAQKDGSVLFVGRLVEAKGVRDVVTAWQRANVNRPLVIAGAGPERGALNQIPGIRWEGWVSRARLNELYDEASVVVVASRWEEPYGIVGVEALHKGVFVAAWDSGGVKEWLTEEPSPWGDVDALAKEIRRGVTRRQEPKRIWSAKERWEALLQVYEGVVTNA